MYLISVRRNRNLTKSIAIAWLWSQGSGQGKTVAFLHTLWNLSQVFCGFLKEVKLTPVTKIGSNMEVVCNSVLIGNSRIEDHIPQCYDFRGRQKNTRSLCSWILLSRAADAEHGMVVVMLRMRIRMKCLPPPVTPVSPSWDLQSPGHPLVQTLGNMEWAGTSSSSPGSRLPSCLGCSSLPVLSLPPALAADSLLIASG